MQYYIRFSIRKESTVSRPLNSAKSPHVDSCSQVPEAFLYFSFTFVVFFLKASPGTG